MPIVVTGAKCLAGDWNDPVGANRGYLERIIGVVY